MSRSNALRYYVIARLLLAPLMILTIATVVFLLLRASPGDPVDALLGGRAPQEAKDVMRAQLGLDAPLIVQYWRYLGSLLTLDLGTSIATRGQTVWDIIGDHFPATVELVLCSLPVAVIIGLGVGGDRSVSPQFAAGCWRSSIWYRDLCHADLLVRYCDAADICGAARLGTYLDTVSDRHRSPSGAYWTVSARQSFMGRLDLFAISLHHLVLPSVTLGLLRSGIFERIVRVNLKQTLRADYVEAARARGIPEVRIVLVHALKNALIPVVTIFGLTFASMLGGAVLTEVTFSWPGLANRLYEAITQRDYPVVQGLMVFFGIIVVIVSIAIDIVNAYIDPRIRY